MKKIFACLLTIALIFSTFSTALAADTGATSGGVFKVTTGKLDGADTIDFYIPDNYTQGLIKTYTLYDNSSNILDQIGRKQLGENYALFKFLLNLLDSLDTSDSYSSALGSVASKTLGLDKYASLLAIAGYLVGKGVGSIEDVSEGNGVIIRWIVKGFDIKIVSQPGPASAPTSAKVNINVTVSPSQGGTISGGGTIKQGSTQLDATPKSGWKFDGWYENNTCVSTKAAWRFDATRDMTLEARFSQTQSQSQSNNNTQSNTTTQPSLTVTSSVAGSYTVIIPANTTVYGFSNSTSTAKLTLYTPKTASYPLVCTAKLTMSDGTTRYLFRSGGSTANNYYLLFTSAMSVSNASTSSTTSTPTTPSQTQLITDGLYKITTKLDQRYCLAVNGSTSNSGLILIGNYAFPYAGFRLTSLGNSYYSIKCDYYNMALTSDSTGANLYVSPDSGADTQIWKIQKASDGVYQVINKASGKFLDVTNANATEGNKVGLFVQNDAYDAQKWLFTPVSSGSQQSGTATIQYNANGGTGAPASQTVTKDNTGTITFDLPTAQPTRSGYSFTGWLLGNSSTNELGMPGQKLSIPTGNSTSNDTLTFYAQWQATSASHGASTPTVSFSNMSTGWSGSGFYFQFSYIAQGSNVADVYVTTQTDAGYKSSDYAGPWYMSDSLRIYAPVNYFTEGKTYSWAATVLIDGKEIVSPVCSFIYTNNGATGGSTVSPAANGTVTIQYNANGGSGTPVGQTVTKDSNGNATLTLSTTIPTRSGYTFLGWLRENNTAYAVASPGQQVTINTGDAKSSLTLYYFAQWQAVASTPSQSTTGGGSASFSNMGAYWSGKNFVFNFRYSAVGNVTEVGVTFQIKSGTRSISSASSAQSDTFITSNPFIQNGVDTSGGWTYGGTYNWTAYVIVNGQRIESQTQSFVFLAPSGS